MQIALLCLEEQLYSIPSCLLTRFFFLDLISSPSPIDFVDCFVFDRKKSLEIRMSLHQIHSDVEEGEVFVVSPSSDVQRHSHTELMEYPSYTSSRSSNPAVIAINSENPTSKEKVHAKSWDHVTSFFVDWWVRAVNLFVDWWMGELLAILLSIITLFAIIYVLRKHDGHNLPTFPHNVSLNFIVSTLATVSKSSLLFAVASALGQFKWLWMFSKQRRLQDLQVFYDASRGPLGSSRLLASRKSL